MAAAERAITELYGQYAPAAGVGLSTPVGGRALSGPPGKPAPSDQIQIPSRSRSSLAAIASHAELSGLVVLEADDHAIHARIKLVYERGIHDRRAVDAHESPRVEPSFEIGQRFEALKGRKLFRGKTMEVDEQIVQATSE